MLMEVAISRAIFRRRLLEAVNALPFLTSSMAHQDSRRGVTMGRVLTGPPNLLLKQDTRGSGRSMAGC